MPKKKDKFKTIGSEFKLKNIHIEDIDDIYYYETSQNTRVKSAKTLLKKGQKTCKSDVNLMIGRVVEVYANNSYKVEIEAKEQCIAAMSLSPPVARLSGRLKYIAHETRNPICVGDYVHIDVSHPENMRIEEILPRKNLLSRYIASSKKNVLFASNIDYVVIVVSVAQPDFNPFLIDRYLCITEICGIATMICVNKIDLLDDGLELDTIKDTCDYYTQIGYPVLFTSVAQNICIDQLKEYLKDKDTLFTGHSGTGKSSLINALQPGLNLRIGEVSDSHTKGTHTTTSSRLIKWSFGGHLIDSPGLKNLGIYDDDYELLPKCFPGFARWAGECEFANCTHTHEELCGVKKRVGAEIPEDRYDSYLGLRKCPN